MKGEGYVISALAIVALLFLQPSKRKPADRVLSGRLVGVVVYSWLSLFIFLHARRAASLFLNAPVDDPVFLEQGFQTALVIIACGMVLQSLLVNKPKHVFFRMLWTTILFALFGFLTFPFIGFGIINVVWVVVLAGTLAGLTLVVAIFFSLEKVLEGVEKIPGREEKRKVLDQVRDEMNRFLRFGIQAFLALAASIGVSMSILFSSGENGWKDVELLTSAMQLVAGFVMVSVGLAFWLVKPYLDHFMAVRNYYEQTFESKARLIL